MKKRTMHYGNRIGKPTPGSICCYVLITLWCLFIFAMFAWTIAASLSTTKEIFNGSLLASGFHWENYVEAAVSNHVLTYFKNSLIYSVISCILIIVISAPAAYVLARYEFKGNKFLQIMFTSGMGIPLIMVILPLFYIASVLQVVGDRWVVILLYVGTNIPFTIFYLVSFFQKIPTIFEEAAAIDGCTPIKAFWKIIFPLCQPGIITVSIFNFIAIWNEYFIGLIFASKTAIRPVAVGLQNMINSMRYSGNWAGMFAVLVIVFVPSIIFYVALSEKIIAGATGGAVKG